MATIKGSTDNDALAGTGIDDTIEGGSGNDTIAGLGGNDLIYGDSGDEPPAQSAAPVDSADVTVGDGSNVKVKVDEILDPGGNIDNENDITFFDGGGVNNFSNLTISKIGKDDGEEDIFRFDLSGFNDNFILELKSEEANDKIVFTDVSSFIDNGNNTFTISYIGNDNAEHTVEVEPGDAQVEVFLAPPAPSDETNDSIDGGDGLDTIFGEEGDDTINGGAGNDSISGGGDNDSIDGGGGNDRIEGDTGDDTLRGDAGDDTIAGSRGSDSILGGPGNDRLIGGSNAGEFPARGDLGLDSFDTIFGGAGNDTIFGNVGNDSIGGGSGNDSIVGGGGDDSIVGGGATDSVFGGAGNDSIDGGAGNDSIDSGLGNDTIFASTGADTVGGGDDADTYAVPGATTILDDTETITVVVDENGNGTVVKTVDGTIDVIGSIENFIADEAAAENDQLTYTTIVIDEGTITGLDSATGSFTTKNGDIIAFGGAGGEPTFVELLAQTRTGDFTVNGANLTGSINNITFTDFETVQFSVVCFVRGTLIRTSSGNIPIENLVVGDSVLTLDNGFQPLRWIGKRRLSRVEMENNPKLKPIRIKAGALGSNLPEQDLLVSPQHRVLVRNGIVARMFDETEVLVPANKLLAMPNIDVEQDVDGVDYFHILFSSHEIVYSNGSPTESLFTGTEALKSISPEAQQEVYHLFPEIFDMDFSPCSARLIPKKGKLIKKLVQRMVRNDKQVMEFFH